MEFHGISGIPGLKADRPKTRCVYMYAYVCASVRVASSNIVYYYTDIDPQGKVN